MPVMTTSRSDGQYVDGKCWYGLKLSRSRHSVVPCGLDAREYWMERTDVLSLQTPSVKVKVWACDNHKMSLKLDGFTLTLVQPGVK